MNTAIRDNEVDPTHVRCSPSALGAFHDQCTSEILAEVRRFAASRAQLVRAAGRAVPKNYPTELVNDAVANARLGISRWDPASCSLLVHLCSQIVERTSKEIRRELRFPHVALHVAASDPEEAMRVERALAHASLGNGATDDVAAVISRVAVELAAIAPDDVHASALLDCWVSGLIEREDIRTRTGLSRAAYKAARKRLFFRARKLSSDLRARVDDLLHGIE